MIVSKNPEIIKRCKVMRLHGINRDAFDRFTSKTPAWYYEVIAPGFKYNLSDIASSIGICQLAKADKFQLIRQTIAQRYLSELVSLPLILPPDIKNPATDLHSWHLFCCQLNTDRISRNEFIQAMSDKGIGTSVHYIPLHMQPYWKERYSLKDAQFPNATKYYKNAVSLPLYTKMTDDDQMHVINTIKEILN
jgi:dTDP-4-amino-4,6-dideoxygalactose transaminase